MHDESPTCREVAAMVDDHLDDRLTLPRRRRLERHVAGCRDCAALIALAGAAIRVCRGLGEGPPGPGPSGALLRAFRRAGGAGPG